MRKFMKEYDEKFRGKSLLLEHQVGLMIII